METRHLKYFIAVAEERHFGRAAAKLHMAQPPLSQQIRQLEELLGTPLLVRTTRKVELTPAGQVLLDRGRVVLRELEVLESDVRQVGEGATGVLRVGFTGTATYRLMPVIVQAARRTLPGLRITVQGEMLTPQMEAALEEGRLDAAVLRPPVHSAGIALKLLEQDHLVAALPADSPLAEVCARARGVHIDVGRGRTSSRTALWSLLTPVVLAADALGLIQAGESVLAETADRLDLHAEACRPRSESFVNPAKILAMQLAETIPMVLGDGPLNGVAASRAASMLARTARIPATYGELPDAASQIVASFDGPFTAGGGRGAGARESAPDIFADPFLDGPAQPRLGLLMLRDAPPATKTPQWTDANSLTEAVLQTAYDAGVQVSIVAADPGHPLVRLAGQIAQTDFAATYLAIGLGLDPAVSPHVADLRDRIRG